MAIDKYQTVMVVGSSCRPPLEGVENNVPLFHFQVSSPHPSGRFLNSRRYDPLSITSNVVMMGGCKVFIYRQSRHVPNLPMTVPSRP